MEISHPSCTIRILFDSQRRGQKNRFHVNLGLGVVIISRLFSTKAFVFAIWIPISIFYVNCSDFQPNRSSTQSLDSLAQGEFNPVSSKSSRPINPREYGATISSVFGVDPDLVSEILPTDTNEIFTLDIEEGDSVLALTPFEEAAIAVSAAVLADKEKLDTALNCDEQDRQCLLNYSLRIASVLFRKKLVAADVEGLVDLALTHAEEASDFYAGVDTVINYCLLHPSFIFHWEVGSSGIEQGLSKLTNMELISRLSFFILGTAPDYELIQSVPEEDYTPEGLEKIVDGMLEDPRARKMADDFHAMWLGYQDVGVSERGRNLRTETRALVESVIFDKNEPWSQLLLREETFVNRSLAADYNLQYSGGEGFQWVPYGNTGRKGLLSHGSFLSDATAGDVTNPTQRGYAIRKALFCGELGDPPPEIDVDEELTTEDPNDCKSDVIHKTVLKPNTSCVGCHNDMDRVGFGLENFDNFGIFRETETNRPECILEGKGTLTGIGDFNGPGELADLAIISGEAEKCLVRRVVEFGFHRRISNYQSRDYADLLGYLEQSYDIDGTFKGLIKAVTLSAEFRYIKEEEE